MTTGKLREDGGVTRSDRLSPLPIDEITTGLRQLAAALEVDLADIATVSRERAEDTGAVEATNVVPRRDGAVGVWSMHSSEDIVLGLGDAPGWNLPRSTASVDVVRAIVEETAAGRVEVGKGRGITTYRVRTPDGVVHEDTHEGVIGFLLSLPWKPRLRWESAAAY